MKYQNGRGKREKETKKREREEQERRIEHEGRNIVASGKCWGYVVRTSFSSTRFSIFSTTSVHKKFSLSLSFSPHHCRTTLSDIPCFCTIDISFCFKNDTEKWRNNVLHYKQMPSQKTFWKSFFLNSRSYQCFEHHENVQHRNLLAQNRTITRLVFGELPHPLSVA